MEYENNDWNQIYVCYANYHGLQPEEMIENHKYANFISWHMKQKQIFLENHPEHRHKLYKDHLLSCSHSAYHSWLEYRYLYVVKCNNCNTSYSLDKFRELEFVGIQEMTEEDPLEYRNCSCRSTISILVNKDALEDPEKGEKR